MVGGRMGVVWEVRACVSGTRAALWTMKLN